MQEFGRETCRQETLGSPRNRCEFNGPYIQDRKAWNGFIWRRIDTSGGLSVDAVIKICVP